MYLINLISYILTKANTEKDNRFAMNYDTSLTEVNSFSPSVPISPSSMINQYKFEDGPELRDLFITVDDPESHITAIETFITYRVVTKTTRGEFDSSEYEVRRRYQDFLWLKSKLEEAHPTLIIPPLPEKFIMKGMVERFSDEFIETRRKALHKFLNRIADHPTLTFNEDFKIFLTAQAWELSSHKKQGPGLLSRMGQTVRAVASSVRGAVKNRPEMFTEMNNYMETFSQKINLLDKIAHRIYKEERDYFNEMKEYGPIHTLWSASEEDLADSLKGIASCIERCCRATEKRMAGLSEHLLPILHEYVLYSEILMGVLKRRDQIQGELDSKVDALANKKTEKDLFSEEIGKLEDKVERANNALKADWDRWKQNMQWDMRSTFTNVAENNLRYYEECLATWESFLTSQTVDLHFLPTKVLYMRSDTLLNLTVKISEMQETSLLNTQIVSVEEKEAPEILKGAYMSPSVDNSPCRGESVPGGQCSAEGLCLFSSRSLQEAGKNNMAGLCSFPSVNSLMIFFNMRASINLSNNFSTTEIPLNAELPFHRTVHKAILKETLTTGHSQLTPTSLKREFSPSACVPGILSSPFSALLEPGRRCLAPAASSALPRAFAAL
ncbi:hypothetical protein IHE44_0014907 [Lamprotornis superbus]|uniref:PX domain-containing protein n=1 Tax=Lamprotornis superbus TaxID=245042 RepID=A0A835U2X2_9PASS|nr:hypothetical protein IHE44_0014907 [Lamprotornis superbus]